MVAGARNGAWLNLLVMVAAQTEERNRRLVVVVDGLDEDEAGAVPRRGRPSIASLLPRRPPPGVRIIVTSRPDPGLADDLPLDHPLRVCIPRRLPVSWVAKNLAFRARQELRDLLTGDQVAVDVVGYIAGSGGGLTKGDLSTLASAPPRKLDPILRGAFGRSLSSRTPQYPGGSRADPAACIYLFAHETLRVTAEEQLGNELAHYRQQIHEWIGTYASAGWPDATPGYAIRSYPQMLEAKTDVTRLSVLARDRRRHVFLLKATGNDYAALTEIRAAQNLVANQDAVDLQALVELAAHQHAISIRNRFIPTGLPVVWARIHHFDHAEALARTIADPGVRTRALAELAAAVVQEGDADRACRLTAESDALARTLNSPYPDWSNRRRSSCDCAGRRS